MGAVCQTTTQALALLIKVVCPLSIASKGLYTENQSANMASDTIWSFGYGSNMDVVAMEAKKSVKVLEHTPAILKGYKMECNLKSPFHHVEPAYAGLAESPDSE